MDLWSIEFFILKSFPFFRLEIRIWKMQQEKRIARWNSINNLRDVNFIFDRSKITMEVNAVQTKFSLTIRFTERKAEMVDGDREREEERMCEPRFVVGDTQMREISTFNSN